MNKIFHIGSTFKAFEEDDDIFIRGMASTADTDRVGDIIEAAAWTKGGLKNYLNNPVILFNHDYNQPIGRAIELSTGDNGLQLKAKIAKSAGHVRELIKEGVLGAFSVGFRVKDAEYLKESDGYKIKDAELLEVSVVTVPANQAATFSLAKSFNSESEYEEFKKTLKDSFGKNESVDFVEEVKAQEKTMSDIDINAIVAAAVEKTATAMAMKDAEKKAEEARKQKALEEEAAKKAADEARIITAVQSGTERLMQDVEKRLSEKDADYTRVVNELQSELREKSEEIQKIRESKRVFSNRSDEKSFDVEAAKDAFVLGVITRKGLDTKIGRQFIEKTTNDSAGVRVPNLGTTIEPFESIVSTSIEQDIQLELILDPLFRKIAMNAASMVVPTLPDTGYADFANNAFAAGTGIPGASGTYKGSLEPRLGGSESPLNSPGANSGIEMGQKTLTTFRMTSKSYIANEVEEDAIIPVLPYIREAMVRAHARGIEQSLLLGKYSGSIYSNTGYKGLAQLATDDGKTADFGGGSPAAVGGTSSDQVTARKLLDLRQLMGKYGRNPNDLVFIVSLDAYYDLLDDTEYDDVNLVGQGLATKVTGQVGSIYATPVIVCDEFGPRSNSAPAAIAVNVRNFVIPVLRGVTVEQDYDVENQRRILVATQRRGFDRMFATPGQVVLGTW
jgi:HK97 family phage prohead protease